LGTFLLFLIIWSWIGVWQVRALVPASFGALLFGLAISALFYFSARLVFPQDPQAWGHLDRHFLKVRRLVFGSVIVSDLLTVLGTALLRNHAPSVWFIIAEVSFCWIMVVCCVLRQPRLILVLLICLNLLWLEGPLKEALGVPREPYGIAGTQVLFAISVLLSLILLVMEARQKRAGDRSPQVQQEVG
jgi:hypothetical protein